ncbi:tellurite resistance TerB family protein [Sneathiella chinensis]|uniref:Co-chaperone DjlA N-terminal domain-containing protein n=1 Tax=Sneathiella chinensis TaxID=349750 RepID=A0ABQ5U7B6_9PROT|nr:TerB family tellurite resistance protein [Sneathiella chinensis]GLQ08042.1 hypothetical protein GCM10007924_32640 [Sneathiella chinensis]
MLARLKELFVGKGADEASLGNAEDMQVATAALLIEAALSDEDFSETERDTLGAILQRHFSLSEAEAADVIEAAEKSHADTSHLLTFTRVIKENCPIEERSDIIALMWEIAYADGTLSKFEANLIRRTCGLIYVSDLESGQARKRVMQKLGVTE